MSDDAWSNFIASIDPVQLERERMRVISDLDNERPGSHQDHEMRAAHEWLCDQRRNRTDPELDRRRKEADRADADLAIWQQRYANPQKINEEQLEAAIAAYRARQKAA